MPASWQRALYLPLIILAWLAVLLGILAFFMEFVPIIGVIISGSVCVVAALFKGWVLALIVIGYFAVVHIIEGDVVGPCMMGRAVGIHPATALIGLVAGTELFGFGGTLFAAPLAGLVQAIATAAWREVRGRNPHAGPHAVDDPGDQEQREATAAAGKRPGGVVSWRHQVSMIPLRWEPSMGMSAR